MYKYEPELSTNIEISRQNKKIIFSVLTKKRCVKNRSPEQLLTTKKYRMTLEPSSYIGGYLGRIQIPKNDLNNYGTIVGVSFAGDSTAPGSAHVLYENSPDDTWVYVSCIDSTGTLRVSFIKT